jgi:hypothetical protein
MTFPQSTKIQNPAHSFDAAATHNKITENVTEEINHLEEQKFVEANNPNTISHEEKQS